MSKLSLKKKKKKTKEVEVIIQDMVDTGWYDKTCDKCNKEWIYHRCTSDGEVYLCDDHADWSWDK